MGFSQCLWCFFVTVTFCCFFVLVSETAKSEPQLPVSTHTNSPLTPPFPPPVRRSRPWLKRHMKPPTPRRTPRSPAPTVCPRPSRSSSRNFWRPQTGQNAIHTHNATKCFTGQKRLENKSQQQTGREKGTPAAESASEITTAVGLYGAKTADGSLKRI